MEKGYSYYLNSPADATQIGQLGTWVAATGTPGEDDYVAAHWQKATGNLWFDLTPSADGKQYIVSWASGVDTDTDTAQAAVGEKIKVYDAPSAGLGYNSDSMKVTVDGTEVTPAADAVVAPIALQSGDAWRYEITVNADNKGKDVIFSFTMTVTKDALDDPDKVNPSGLIYNDYDSIPDEVKFETYYAGIHKIDGETEESLSGV